MPIYCKGTDDGDCDKQAYYGLDGKRTHCIKCKSDEMYRLHGKCIVCKKVLASFGLNGKQTHCAQCKRDEMYHPYHTCIVCKKVIASFGLNGKMTHCTKCKSEGMYSPHENKCIVCKEVIASFGLNGKRTHCVGCKTPEMVNSQYINGGKIEDNKKGCTRCGQMKDLSEYKDAKENDTTSCLPCRTTKKEYYTNRYKNDTNYRLEALLRTRVYTGLNGKRKADTTMNLIGCSIEELEKWLNYQLKIRYNIDERDADIEYEIDHFIPCASFNLEKDEEQRKCFHWTNLRYLTKKENRDKRDKMPTQKEIDERQEIVDLYCLRHS